jgi:outer membrane immunogenic protein
MLRGHHRLSPQIRGTNEAEIHRDRGVLSMKKFMLATAALGVLALPAVAADMAPAIYKAPVPVAIAYGWTGWYVGANVGYGWGDPSTDFTATGTNISFPGVIPISNSLAFTDSHSQRLSGVIGGAQLGYNYQFNPSWVLGFETDIQGSGERGSGTSSVPFSGALCTGATNPPPTCFVTTPYNAAATTSYEAKIDWFGTVRGRLGFLVSDQFLVYGTGGLAYGQVSASGTTSVNGSSAFGPFAAPGAGAFSVSSTKVGFTAGGGVEGKLWSNWTWKAEYLYVDLGSLNAAGSFSGVQEFAGPLTALTGASTANTHFRDNVVRVGINYQLSH